jgi:hypothetical protein
MQQELKLELKLQNDKETKVDKNLNRILLRYFLKIKYDVRLRIDPKMRLAVYINRKLINVNISLT